MRIVVDAEFQAADDALVLAFVGEQDDRQETGAVQRAQLRTQAQRIEIGEGGRDDDAFIGFLGRLEEAGMRVAGRRRRRAVSRSSLRMRALELGRSSISNTRGMPSPSGALPDSNSSMPMLRVVEARSRSSSVSIFSRTRLRTRVISCEIVDRLGQEVVGARLQAA